MSARNEYNRAYYAANRDRERMRVIYKRYGVTAEEYTAMWDSQAGHCKICGVEMQHILDRQDRKRPDNACCLDHCHVSGEARGMLCMCCNLMLGYAKDNTSTLDSAIKYLAHIKE